MVADLELGAQRTGHGEGEGTTPPLQPILPQSRVKAAVNPRGRGAGWARSGQLTLRGHLQHTGAGLHVSWVL